jgi:hypothetical protein
MTNPLRGRADTYIEWKIEDSIVGIGGMLLVEGIWDWVFYTIAALPLLIGGGLILARQIREGFHDLCDRQVADLW